MADWAKRPGFIDPPSTAWCTDGFRIEKVEGQYVVMAGGLLESKQYGRFSRLRDAKAYVEEEAWRDVG